MKTGHGNMPHEISRLDRKARYTEPIILAGFGIFLLLLELLKAPWTVLAFLILFSLVVTGYLLGGRMAPTASRPVQILWGTIAALAALMLARGAWFYLSLDLNGWGDVVPVVGIVWLGALWTGLRAEPALSGAEGGCGLREDAFKSERTLPLRVFAIISTLLSLLALTTIAYVAWKSGTVESIRTPWPLLPAWVLPLIGLQWAFALASAWKLQNRFVTAIQTGCAIASTSILTPLLYKIGYGFDGFLHVAGEKILLQTGTLQPKPFYYMGQYVFTTWISKIAELDITDVDRFLVPLTAAILIPAALALTHNKGIALIALVLVPLAPFVATTPHGFAAVLAVTTVVLAAGSWQLAAGWPLPVLFAFWTVLTHPLIGLPILFAVVAIIASRQPPAASRYLSWLLAALAGVSVPLVFGLATTIGSSAGVAFDISRLVDWSAWQPILSSWIPWVGNRFALWPETSMWIEQLLPLIVLVLAIIGAIRSKEKSSQAIWLLAAGSAAVASVTLQLAGDFGFLIDYERGNYAERLWLVAWILLLPLAIPELTDRLERAKHAAPASLIALLVGIGLLGAGASYAALPRHDAVTASRGWSVGRWDVEAVKRIEEDAADRPYTVLANQSVSAAAVRTYGFKRYNNDVFFYPIPTGGELYRLFLRASYEDPSAETMAIAGQLGGSDIAYLVINDYWWDAEALIERAKTHANRFFDIGNGKVWVFYYDLKEPVVPAEPSRE